VAQELEQLQSDRVHPRFARGIDALLSVQRPVVLAHIRSIRGRRPDANPAQIIAILERRYLTAVTSGGALVGASAAIPAVGIGTSLVLSGVETAGFLEASALFAQSVTEIHGIAVTDPERARTLVMTMMLGNGGVDLVRQFAGQAVGTGPSRNVYWGEMVTKSLPRAAFGPIADHIQKAFLRRFAVTQSGTIIGRAIPFGIGAVIGGTGNHLLGRKVVNSARTAFGPPPAAFPLTLDAVPKAPKPEKVSKEPRVRRRDRAALRAAPAPLPPPDPTDRRSGPPPPPRAASG
jgi:hypothetical protein